MTQALRTRDSPGTERRNLVLLWAGQFVNTAGLMMLVPIMPFYLDQIGTSGTTETQTWAGVAIAAPALALTLATPLWGRLGDRIGRKWMVVRALLGLAVAMVVMATAATPLLLVAGRLLQGTLGGVVEAAAAFAGSTGSDKKRGAKLGKSFSATAAGALAGPIAGGFLVGSDALRQLMIVIAVAAVVLAVACVLGLREPERVPGNRHTDRGSRRPSAMRIPGAVPLAVAAIGVYFGVYGLIPVFAEHVTTIAGPDQASRWVGVLHSVMWAATLVGSVWWGKHNDATRRPLGSFVLAAGGCAASIAIVALPLDPVVMIPFRLVQGFCFAALAQSLFLHFSRHAPDEHKSAFVGSVNSYLLIGQSAGPLLAGPMTSVLPAPGAILVMAAACALGWVLTLRPARAEKHPPEVAETGSGRTGTIVRDHAPALHAYEQTGPHGTLRGVLTTVHLDSALLPHQDVIPERVAAIAERMRGGQLDVDPVLLGLSGDGRTTTHLAHASRQRPVTDVLDDDGQRHRLWRISDDGVRDDISHELDQRAAFIADGHHRHAAARHHRRALHAAGHGPGPWDYLPALIVDVTANPLHLEPTHRILPFADPHRALATAQTQFDVRPLDGDLAHWIRVLKHHARSGPAFVVATPRGGHLVTKPDPAFLAAALRDTPPAIRTLHLTVLHTALLDRLWRLPRHRDHIRYEHSAARAVQCVRHNGGIAVLTTPPTQHQLATAAAAGVRLPPKSTSFGPTPHPGLLTSASMRGSREAIDAAGRGP